MFAKKISLKESGLYFLGVLLLFAILVLESREKGDFDIFLSASNDLIYGKYPYAELYHTWYHYYYDLLFALLLSPLTLLPLPLAQFIWLSTNVFFVYRIWKILTVWLPSTQLNKKTYVLFTLVAFIFVSSFLRDNFHLGQVTIFILYLILEGLHLISLDKKFTGSLLIAFGTCVKLLPLLFIPYLIYRREWKATLFVLFCILVFLFLPALFFGLEKNWFLLQERWLLLNPTNPTHLLDTSERSFHSLSTLLATLLVEDCGDSQALELKRNIANVSISQLNLILNTLRLLLIVSTLYFLRSKPFVAAKHSIQRLYEVAYICLLIPLIFPHQQHYAFFFVFPATSYLLFYWFVNQDTLGKTKKYILGVCLFLVYLLLNLRFIVGEFNAYYDHFKSLTYGAILLIPLLVVCAPATLGNNKVKSSE